MYAEHMNLQHYNLYLELDAVGKHKQAKIAIQDFVNSFEDVEEKADWTFDYLSCFKPNSNSRMRHEVYEGIVFPVLLNGFKQNDVDCMFWLGVTIQNLFSAKHLHGQINFLGGYELFEKAYQLHPTSKKIREELLASIIRGFDYCDHEWPAGLLINSEEDSFETIMLDIELARKLDQKGLCRERLLEFETRVATFFETTSSMPLDK